MLFFVGTILVQGQSGAEIQIEKIVVKFQTKQMVTNKAFILFSCLIISRTNKNKFMTLTNRNTVQFK